MSVANSSIACTVKAMHAGSAKHACASESVYPSVPRKIISDPTLIDVFRQSSSYRKIMMYIQACSESVKSTPFSQRTPSTIDQCCPAVRFFVQKFFPFLHRLVDEIPLEDMSHQRFGNRAKRVFHTKMEEQLEAYMHMLVDTFSASCRKTRAGVTGASAEAEVRDTTPSEMKEEAGAHSPDDETVSLEREIGEYVKDSFGNATRLDYGSGHELHFFIVILLCLEQLGDTGETLEEDMGSMIRGHGSTLAKRPTTTFSSAASVSTEHRRAALRSLRQQFVFYVFYEYIRFARRLQDHYSLEPAGSHGVWGLDDYHHIPYIFGAAQLIGCEQDSEPNASTHVHRPAINTGDVCDKAKAAALKDEYMYFAMVSWIYEHKTGPFFEHSNMLYNISGVPRWLKIYGGMVKMFSGEVLTKFNVCQHLLFGKHLPWNVAGMEQRTS